LLILTLAEEIPVLVDEPATNITIQKVRQVVVTLLTFQQTLYTSHNKMCGKIKGYQSYKESMDGFYPSAYAHGKVNSYKPANFSRSLDGVYVDEYP